MPKKKLIEVALPLEKINSESAREKSIRHGHPSTLHLWWARRPLAAARAVIWASLVDDPSSHPELFPTEEAQNIERQRLFRILEDLVVWENSNNQDVLNAAKTEILRSTNGNPPALLDPFAGGGAIPLEAQRLGLEAYANDLNPVAVMINKALIEIPPVFSGKPSVNPCADKLNLSFQQGSFGLVDDVLYYGNWVKNESYKRIGYLYPDVDVPEKYGGGKAKALAWIWARTVKCPNPACGCIMPLASSFVLSKKKGNEFWVKPIPEDGHIRFEVQSGNCPKEYESFKQGRSAIFKCPCCGQITKDAYVKNEGKLRRISSQLMAVVVEGEKGRLYLSPDDTQSKALNVTAPEQYPSGLMPNNPRWFSPPAFGMTDYSDLFTKRQLQALTCFSNLINVVQKQIEKDAIQRGFRDDHISLSNGGEGALAYAQAVCLYLSFALDKAANLWSSTVGWMNDRGAFRETFSRQAIPMAWDYAEANPFSNSAGNYSMFVERCADTLAALTQNIKPGHVSQHDAQSDFGLRNIMVSTDPPYYDNIGYADLSDYFYIWMRTCLGSIFPDVFSTVLVPKKEELIATPYRHNGSTEKAKAFFEDGMLTACKQIYNMASPQIPVTIYYAYKQTDATNKEKDKQVASTGWETMLSAIIKAGFMITGTLPIRTESPGRSIAQGTNALSSSIVLVCRKRPTEKMQITRRNLINELRKELRPALRQLQTSNIAPVDLAQSAIGPGMAVFSKYSKVLEADGSEMTVRSALQVINEELDLYFNEQVGDLDSMSRFCIDLYTQSAFNDIKFGEADVLARAKGTSVEAIASHGSVYAKAGSVHLIERDQLPDSIDHNENCIWMFAQQLTQLMATGGVEACAKAIYDIMGSSAERAKDLAYRLYTIAEQKKWANEAYAYNALVVAWPDIQARAAELRAEQPEQMTLFD